MIIVTSGNNAAAQEDIVKTWSPIIEKMGIVDPGLTDILSRYCHNHSTIENIVNSSPGIVASGSEFFAKTRTESLLPMALKIFSKLNLAGKNVQLATSPNYEYIDDVTEKVGYGESQTFRVSVSANIVEQRVMEELLINKAADAINFSLKKYDTIVIYLLASSMSTIAEAAMSPKVHLNFRLRFFDRNSEPDGLYQVSNTNDFYSVSRITDEKYLKKVTDGQGNSYMLDMEDGSFVQAVTDVDLLNLAEQLENRSEILKSSASSLRLAVFEK